MEGQTLGHDVILLNKKQGISVKDLIIIHVSHRLKNSQVANLRIVNLKRIS